MHIEKNMFENIFNMFMDMNEKIQENIKAEMILVYDVSQFTKPKASFTLNKNS